MTDQLRKLVDSSGFAFQLAVEHLVHSTGCGFTVVATEHGWTHPRTQETGFADIVLEERHHLPGIRLVIECKRVREEGLWVFLCPDERVKRSKTRFTPSSDDLKESVIAHWTAVSNLKQGSGTTVMRCMPPSPYSSFCVVRGSGENQKPMLERIAAQLVQATEAIADEQVRLSLQLRTKNEFNEAWAYVPVIVTNAQLSACLFDPADVPLTDGLLPEKATFEEVSVVRFTKNLASDTSLTAPNNVTAANAAKDRTVLVVSSTHLSSFLKQFDWKGGMPEELRSFVI